MTNESRCSELELTRSGEGRPVFRLALDGVPSGAAARLSRRGVADALKGQVAMAFAILKDPSLADTPAKKLAHEGEMMKTVDSQLGAVARPSRVHFVSVLPKTRSGKLLRRSIQALCEGRDPGDLTTIEDPTALEQIRCAVRA